MQFLVFGHNFSFQELLLSNDILEDIADKLELAIKNNAENKYC